MKMTIACLDRRLALSFVLLFLLCGSVQALPPSADFGTYFVTNNESAVDLIIGEFQPNNSLIVTNNSLLSLSENVKLGKSAASTNNRLTVFSGSAMTIGTVDTGTVAAVGTGGIFIGTNGALNINHSSVVDAEYLYMGLSSNDISATITLNSAGTVLNISEDAYIGTNGSDNVVTINDGATFSFGSLTVGAVTNSSDNVVNVNDGGTLSSGSGTNIAVLGDDNAVNINNGGILQITGDANYNTVADQGVTMNNGSVLEVGGTLTDDNNKLEEGITYRLDNTISSNTASWNVTPSNQVYIGESTDNNRLEIVGGTTQTLYSIDVGSEDLSDSNDLVVEGTGSRLDASNIAIGFSGDNNTFQILNGASANISGNLRIGQESNSVDNAAVISGTGSTLTVAGNILVGNDGSGNSLTVTSNGTVNAESDVVIGAGATTPGDDNELSVLSNGTMQVTGDLVVGRNGDNNTALINGSNATLAVKENLIVGENGTGNRLEISNQGNVEISSDLIVGGNGGTNTAVVTGSNSMLMVAGDIYVGTNSSGNSLTISNQAQVSAMNLYVGSSVTGLSDNVVLITGEDSYLSVSNDIHLGASGSSNNAVNVENGGTLFMASGTNVIAGAGSNNFIHINADGTLEVIDWNFTTASTDIIFNAWATLGVGGTFANTTNAVDRGSFKLAIDGSIATNDALWNAATNTITVGESTDDNALAVLDGGTITASNIIVGSSSESTDNALLAQGTNAQLTVGNDLTVGQDGSSGNTFSVSQNGSADIGRNLMLGDASNNNRIEVGDTGSTNVYGTSQLTVSSNLVIGSNGGSGNTFTIYTNAQVVVSNELQIGQGADNNSLVVNGSNSTLDVTGNLIVGDGDSSGNAFKIYSGTNNLRSDLIIGNSTNSINNRLLVAGSNAVLTVSSNWIVGNYGGGNTAVIQTGATVNVMGDVYVGRYSDNNEINISGSNAVFNILNDLFIGQADRSGNKVKVLDGASLIVSNDLELAGTGSLLQIDSLSSVTVSGNYHQAEGTQLKLGIKTNGVNLTVGGTANFEAGSDIYVDTTGYGGDVGTTNKVQAALVTAETFQIDGILGSLVDLSVLEALFTNNTLREFGVYISNDTIYVDNFTRRSLSTLGLTGNAEIAGDILDELFNADDSTAIFTRETLENMAPEEARATWIDHHGSKESANPIHKMVNGAVGGFLQQVFGRQEDVRTKMGMEANGYSTIGAPPASNQYQEVHGWMQGFGSWADKDEDGAYYGYDASTYGTVVGFDLLVNEHVLFGVAGGYSTSDVDKDNGATGEADSQYGAVYGSVAGEEWFFDGGLIFGRSSIDQDLNDVFDTTASYDAKNIAVRLGVGREMVGQYFIVTPQVGVLANYYDQDAYTEESTTTPRDVDGFDELYIQSSVGGNVGMYMSWGDLTVRSEVRAHWLHEFNADEEDVNYTMAGNPQQLIMTMQAREEDVIRIGAGVAVQLSEYLELRMDANAGSSGDYNQFDLSGTLRYQF